MNTAYEYVCSIAGCGVSCCLLTLGCRLQFAKCSLGHGLLSDRGVSCKATFVILFKQFALVFLQLEFWLYMLRFSSITVCLFVELFALVVLLVDSLGSVDEGTTGGIGVDVVPSSALSNTVVTLWLVVAFAAANCAWSSALSF